MKQTDKKRLCVTLSLVSFFSISSWNRGRVVKIKHRIFGKTHLSHFVESLKKTHYGTFLNLAVIGSKFYQILTCCNDYNCINSMKNLKRSIFCVSM